MANILTDGLDTYCPTGAKAGETILSSIAIYNQCESPLGSPRLIINPDDLVENSGIKFTNQRNYTEIKTSAAVTKIQTMFAGSPVMYTAQLQRDAFSKKVDTLIEGENYADYVARPGWEFLNIADRTGKYVPTYSALISYFKNGDELFAQDWVPNCEFMVTDQGAMAAGVVFSRTLEIMALPIPGDLLGTRVRRLRKK
jgi:hypothetical protein